MKSLEPNKIYALTAYTIDNNPKETIALIRKNGVMISDNATSTQIEKAFAALLPKSEKFRNDFSKLILRTAQEDYSGFASTDLPSGKGLSTTDPFSKAFGSVSTTTPIEAPTGVTTKTKKSFSDTAVGSFLSGLLTPENAQSAINTGLNVWSIKQTGQPASVVTTDLNAGRNELPQSGSGKGISTTTTIVLVVGAIALIGIAVYFYKKK